MRPPWSRSGSRPAWPHAPRDPLPRTRRAFAIGGLADIRVVYLNAPPANTPEEHLLLQVQGMIAEYERAQLLERTRRGKRHKARW